MTSVVVFDRHRAVNLERATKTLLAERIVALEATLASRDEALAKAYAHAAALEAERDALRAAHERLRLEVELARRRIVLGTAERIDTTQLELEFAEKLAALNALADTADDEPMTAKEDKPKMKPKGRRDLRQSALPIERVELPDATFEALIAEGRAERVRVEESRAIGYVRGGPRVVEVARVIYRMTRVSTGDSTLIAAPMPPRLFPRMLAAPSMLAHIIAQKYVMGTPLYRLEDRWRREGVPIDRGTMARWLEEAGATFGATLVDAMVKDAIANAFCIATDATGVLIQPIPNEQRTRQPCKRGHIFTQVVDRDAVIFSYTERETSDAVKALFKGFNGYVQADAKSVYDALFRPPDDASAKADTPTEVGCWGHARRKFWEATVTKDAIAREGLVRIGRMFELEKTWRDKPPSERLRLRGKHMTVHLAEFFAWADNEHQNGARPRGLLTTALGYVVRQKNALETFVRDGRLVMDNNRSERALRAVAVGRKSWLFCGSDEHASAAANLMTLVASAKLHGLDPELYLCELTRVLPHWPRERFIELAPKNWAQTRLRLDPKQVDAEFGWLTVPPTEEQPLAR